ncbi:NmrA family transcriptional regulator [Nocardia sp. MDA0666]|uniref:NmrA family NAD(P)-binding protein n=1 Tax=Nocardia sp. MDA0666 TaxID=2135448 RepID=UPI000D1239F1|nr:NmrA family NAD(P)-binding protein [Nocardia sp. MDA0666]PSR66697.1 NmrA family transcriptional regulator [Nocardia sp. MDA0666]
MIVVTTPTGSIGHQVLDLVADSDQPIRVIARDPARLAPHIRERVDVVQGSTTDREVVAAAVKGADTVFWLVPPNPAAPSVPGHVLEFVTPLCEALDSVGRIVAVSSLGRAGGRKAGQISAIFAMDALIESSGVHYRSLCPPGFMDNMLRQVDPIRNLGTFFGTISGDLRAPTCATRDIAAVAARLLLDESWTGQDSVEIRGPEDLSHNEMARIMSEVLGRSIAYQQVPAADYAASLTAHGMSAAWAQGLVDMSAAVEDGLYDTPRTPESYSPTGFRQWCEEVLAPAVAG